MWITIACDRETEKMWICTIAQTREAALYRLRSELKILDHQAFNIMVPTFNHQLGVWFKKLGFTTNEATSMVQGFAEKMSEVTLEPVKNAHKSN